MSFQEAHLCLISPDVKLGRNVRMRAFVNLYGCTIGDDVRIGTFVEIQKGAVIGNGCKISSHTFICEGVTLEDEVFVLARRMMKEFRRATPNGRVKPRWLNAARRLAPALLSCAA